MKSPGKKFEQMVRDSLARMQLDHGLFFHRLKDSTSAGRIIGNSPADFLVAFSSHAELWEAKSSEVHASLRSCLSAMVDSDQVGYHNLWHRNGLNSYFLFYSDLTGMVEIWNGQTIVAARKSGKVLRLVDMATMCSADDLTSELEMLLEFKEAR